MDPSERVAMGAYAQASNFLNEERTTAQPCRDHEKSSDEKGELSCICSIAALAPVCHLSYAALLPVPSQLVSISMTESSYG